MTLGRIRTCWFVFCVCGALIVWAGVRGNEVQCRARDGYLCFSDRDVLLLVGLPAAAVLVGGLLVIAGVWKVIEGAKRRRA
jgi:hypothetical protein